MMRAMGWFTRRGARRDGRCDARAVVVALLAAGLSGGCSDSSSSVDHPSSGRGDSGQSGGVPSGASGSSAGGVSTGSSSAGSSGSAGTGASSGNTATSGGETGSSGSVSAESGVRGAASGASNTTGAGGDSGSDDAGEMTGSSGAAGGAGGVLDSGAVTGSSGSGAPDASGATDELVHYSGRWNVQADRATTVNSGSYAIAQFAGTAIAARFDVSVNDKTDMPTVAWRVDNAATWQVAEIAASLPLATGLAVGNHSIELVARGLDENKARWTPPLVSGMAFLGFSVTGGALQATPRPQQPKIEILGDSITEGVIVQGSSFQGHTGQCWINDAVHSYPTLTGMALGADYRQVGFGFQGVLKGGDGGVPAANDSFNWIYKNVPRDSWQADMVVINQGTNDSSQPAATFKTAYTAFVATIRKGYPKAKIVALRPFGGYQADSIKAVVTASNTAGDARVFYVDTTGWLSTGDFNGLHPNVQGSAKAATALVSAIQKIGLP